MLRIGLVSTRSLPLVNLTLHLNSTLARRLPLLRADLVVKRVLFEGFLDTIAGLAFTFDVIVVVLDAWPALVSASSRVEVGHHVLALLVVVSLAHTICFAGCVCGDAVEGPVTFQAVYYFVVGRRFEGLAVGFAEGVERGVV